MSRFSEGQTHHLMNALEAAKFSPEHVTKLGQYHQLSDFRLVLDGHAEIVRRMPTVTETVVKPKMYLRRLCTFPLGATSGKDTYEMARKVFKLGFHPNFEQFGIIFSGIAPETEIATDVLVSIGEFSEFIGNIAMEFEKRRVLGSQFLEICREKPEELDQDCMNFFVLTKNDEVVAEDLSNVFVARVLAFFYRGKPAELDADILFFSCDKVWTGEGHRIFSPQQSLVPPVSAE